jgi:MFS transporter, BCD family, chlorophyll transporter
VTLERGLSWPEIVRLGAVQACLGSIVVLITSTFNRVMVVELALPALLPGILVAIHYLAQMLRPRFGHGSDRGGRRTPWIVGGMAALAAGGVFAAWSVMLMRDNRLWGIGLAVIAYITIGLGVGAAGTNLLVLLAQRIGAARRAAGATIMWVMMIAGFAVTASVAGRWLDPFSNARLLDVTAVVAAIAFVVSVLALRGLEPSRPASAVRAAAEPASTSTPTSPSKSNSFRHALLQVWSEPRARRFTLFIFLSMLAYSAQELILESFAGLVFGYSIGASTQLSGLQHAAVFSGMILVAIACGALKIGSLRAWTVAGCIASAVAIAGLAGADLIGSHWPLRGNVVALGVANGAFAVGAIGSMMELAHAGGGERAGVRMGLWGGAQAIAFACGGIFVTAVLDSIRALGGLPVTAFAIVFACEAGFFMVAALFAVRVSILDRSVRSSLVVVRA